jgi:RNA polymerase sigma factor (sigma-70 family)
MLAGDELAWRRFHEAYFDRLWRYLLVVAAGNEDTAREALQAAFMRITRHIKVFTDEEVLWSWLTVLARSAFTDETRRQHRYFSFLERFTRHAEVTADGLDDGQADERLQTLLDQQITALSADEQELIRQKYNAHKSVREIAGDWQMTEKAVESKLSRIRAKLKDGALMALKNDAQINLLDERKG